MTNVTDINSRRCGLCSGYIEPLRSPTTGEVVWEGGHNALPIADTRCCNECNVHRVIPARIDQLNSR
jgi:hypothetical protein